MSGYSLLTICKKALILLLLGVPFSFFAKQAIDYNGTPLSPAGSITITPHTSSAILASYTQAVNYAGMVDNTFLFDANTAAAGIATSILPQGNAFIAGGYNPLAPQFFLTRYTLYGSIDPSFNFSLDSAPAGYLYGLAMQSDGKIVAVGANATENAFQLARYNADGSVDPTFNFNFGTAATGNARTAILQSNGKIIAIGGTILNGAGTFILIRYNPDASVDSTFDFDPGTAIGGFAYAAALQPDGKIVAAGTTASRGLFQLARYNPDGSVDPTFTFTSSNFIGGFAYAVLLQPDGKIVAAGTNVTRRFIQLVRYNSDGSVDHTFDFTYRVRGFIYALLLQSDGKIITVGTSAGGNQFQLIRYNTDGSVDLTFTLNPDPIINGTAFTSLLLSDGKIVALGTNATRSHFQCARYINPFTLASFTTNYGSVGML